MKCINHPEVDAVDVCEKCGKSLCILCKHELHNKTLCQPCVKEILTQKAGISLILEKIEKRNTKTYLDEASKLSIAAKYCGICGLYGLIVVAIGLFPGAATGNFSFSTFALGVSVTLFILAVIFGVLSLFRHPSPSSCINAIGGLLLGTVPLIIVGAIYLKSSNVQSTDVYQYTGITLCISGVIIGILSFLRHLHKHKIKTLLIELLLCIILVIFGSVYLVKSHKETLAPAVGCATGCPNRVVGDGFCNPYCFNSACNWDNGDCGVTSGCAAGCLPKWIEDDYCNEPCNVSACNYDGGDCR
jgi:hypothetical protein